jgi:hypothetical protein
MSLITAFTLLTGYYATVFIGLLGLYAIFLLCRNKKITEIPYYFMVLFLGMAYTVILYPKYISGFFSYRGQEAINTISNNLPENLRISTTIAVTLLQKHFFTIPVIAICILCVACILLLIYQKKSNIKKISDAQKTALYIFCTSALYLFIVLIIAPYKVLRYGMPVFPFFVILPAMLVDSLQARSQKAATCAMLLLCGCCAFNAARESNIENIFRGKPNQYIFTKDKEMPVYVVNASWSSWKYANLIPYVNDEQSYYFLDWWPYFEDYYENGGDIANIPMPEAENYDTFYLLIEYIPEESNLEGQIMENLPLTHGTVESEFEINTGEPEQEFPYFKGKKISFK